MQCKLLTPRALTIRLISFPSFNSELFRWMAALAGNLRDDLGSGRIATNYSGADDETGYQIVSAMATAAAAPVNEDARQSRSTSEAPVLLLSQVLPAGVFGPRDRTGGWSRKGQHKRNCGGCSFSLAGSDWEPVAEAFFSLDCTRGASHTNVQLTMDQVDSGVKNCCTENCFTRNQACNLNCKTVFMYKLTIEAHPRSWTPADCYRLKLQPHHTAEVLGLQQTRISASKCLRSALSKLLSHTKSAIQFLKLCLHMHGVLLEETIQPIQYHGIPMAAGLT